MSDTPTDYSERERGFTDGLDDAMCGAEFVTDLGIMSDDYQAGYIAGFESWPS